MEATYDRNVILDLEFTHVPKRQRVNGLATEIIEIGAVMVAPDNSIIDEFSRMVKPTLAHNVSGAVHYMTGIGNEDIVCAKPLDTVLDDFADWIGHRKTRLVTWSDTDRRQVTRECSTKGISAELPARWLDIQRLYPRLMGIEKRLVKLGDAADWLGIANDRLSAHRALYDAQITAEYS